MIDNTHFKSGYANINDLKMYYEIYGQGKPLVLIHGGGSTIQTSFGRIIPLLATNRKIIAVELQAHGRTGDRNTYLSFEQDADDVAKLLDYLETSKADILGFSNGAHTAIEMAIRHAVWLVSWFCVQLSISAVQRLRNFGKGLIVPGCTICLRC